MALGIGFLLFGSVAEAKPPVQWYTRLDKDVVTVGDEITYEISVTHPKGIIVQFPTEEKVFDPFELKRHRPFPRREEGIQVTEGIRYVLTIFRVGEWQIPALTIDYTDYRESALPESPLKQGQASSGVRSSVSTEPLTVLVRSVLGESPSPGLDIQKLKPPKEDRLPRIFRTAAVAFLSVGALCIGLYGFIHFLPKQIPRLQREDPKITFGRELRILRQKLDQQRVVTPQDYENLARSLRRFLSGEYDPLSLHWTTHELHERMTEYPPTRSIADRVHQILSASDLVKFASREISRDELELFLRDLEGLLPEKPG